MSNVSSSVYSGIKQTHRNYLPDRGMIFDSVEDYGLYTGYTKWKLTNSSALGILQDDLLNKVDVLATLSWTWKNTLIINSNMRLDWSNAFGDKSNERLLPIWSAAARWNAHNTLLRNVPWVNTLAIKVSYGYQGNMLKDQSPRMIIRKGGGTRISTPMSLR